MSNNCTLKKFRLICITAIVTFFVTSMGVHISNIINPNYNLISDSDGISLESINKFNRVRNLLQNFYYEDVNLENMLEGSIRGMVDSFDDPYTVYYNKEQMKAFSEKSEGSYVGIGVSITSDNDGVLTVVEPFEGSPAKKAGIKKGDKIIRVDGKDVTSYRDQNIIINMIKGKENTEVKITVYRPSEEKSFDFTMIREKVKIVNIRSEILEDNIGYIRIIMFDNEIGRYFEEELEKLLEAGIQGLILDVRDNPGGDYNEVVDIADRLLPKGIIVYTEDREGNQRIERSNNIEVNLPIAVLINGNSASASEVLAGAIKDHNKGVLVGTQTFGKGLVQTVFPLEDGAGVKLTTARYFTPSGTSIHGIGIEPDFEIKISDKYHNYPISQIPRESDLQLNKATEIISNQIAPQ